MSRPWNKATQLPDNLMPKIEGQFDTFNDWVSHASRALTGLTGSVGQELSYFCVDALGRRCTCGRDFMQARDDNAFPVRYFTEFCFVDAGEARL